MRQSGAEVIHTYRILSLSGGGVRGIFQAVFLQQLRKELNKPLSNYFDMIAGTSTGAILALAVAFDKDLDAVVDFYREKSAAIFAPRFASWLRRGPHYDQSLLKQYLTVMFGNLRLSDTKKDLVITATALDRFEHHIFSNIASLGRTDSHLTVADVALASAAAPTYFNPVMPVGQERSYLDGGMWANSPSLPSTLIAHHNLGIPLTSIRMLCVGNGYVPVGRTPSDLIRLRPFSMGTLRMILELLRGCQATFSNSYSAELISQQNFLKIDLPLGTSIALDDVNRAVNILPALAQQEAQRFAPRLAELLTQSLNVARHVTPPPLIAEMIPAAGLNAFYPSRDYYASLRPDAGSIDRYVASANKTVVMVSINLQTGVPFDGLCDVLRKKLAPFESEFSVTISLLDPFNEHLMCSLAPALDKEAAGLSLSIQETFQRLLDLKKSLERRAQDRLLIRAHSAIPFGSAILLDHKDTAGKIQIETKVYKAPFSKSFAFEVVPTSSSGFYAVLARGYETLIDDGFEMTMEYLDSMGKQARPTGAG